MKRWILRILGVAILGYTVFLALDFHRAGYTTLPDIPDGAYTLSFQNGFRAIVLDANVSDATRADAPKYFRSISWANPDRRYLGAPFEVQRWFESAWSWCTAPTEQEVVYLDQMPEDFRRTFENARFEAVCRIDVDGTQIVRGLIFSVPRL